MQEQINVNFNRLQAKKRYPHRVLGQRTRIFDFICTRLAFIWPCRYVVQSRTRIGSCGPGCLFRLCPGSRSDIHLLTNSIQRRRDPGWPTQKFSINKVTVHSLISPYLIHQRGKCTKTGYNASRINVIKIKLYKKNKKNYVFVTHFHATRGLWRKARVWTPRLGRTCSLRI